jgi:hypothetical protein
LVLLFGGAIYYILIHPILANNYSPSLQLLAQLDYFAMDANGIQHSAMESVVKDCVRSCMRRAPQQPCESACVCSDNEMLHSFSKDELAFVMSTRSTNWPNDLKQKVDYTAFKCRQQR